ncbi:MAG TPA: hypothetical protein VIU61_21180 [Kofleriaceae bacterium]
MRFLLVLAVACSDAPRSPACERARDTVLELQERYLGEVMADTPEDEMPALMRQAAREVAKLEKNFVANCKAAEPYYPACFKSPATEDDRVCRDFIAKLARQTVR